MPIKNTKVVKMNLRIIKQSIIRAMGNGIK